MRTRSVVVLLALAVLAFSSAAVAAIADPVRVEQGSLAGTAGSSAEIRVYRGIPYAAPPVGDLRWKAPQPPASWQGVRQATEFSNACWQTQYPPAAAIYQAKLPPLSEDCLYLNIWTPAKAGKDRLPVMVWIHGGGFTRGSGVTRSYDGEVLARKGAVIVTINYRLGVFGFFAHPALSAESGHHASGNYALLDQIAALAVGAEKHCSLRRRSRPRHDLRRVGRLLGGERSYGQPAGQRVVSSRDRRERGIVFSDEDPGRRRKRWRKTGGVSGINSCRCCEGREPDKRPLQ